MDNPYLGPRDLIHTFDPGEDHELKLAKKPQKINDILIPTNKLTADWCKTAFKSTQFSALGKSRVFLLW